jgi:penicillin-binding protein 1A
MVPNVEQTFILPDGSPWTAKNAGTTDYDGKMVTLRWGLAHSVNQVSAWVMKQYNPDAMKGVMQRMGIYSDIPAVPSMFLGTAEITLHEMVAAYAVYANKGVYTTPIIVSRIEDKNGNVLANFSPQRHDALDENTAYLMSNLLQNVVREGSGMRLISRYEVWKDYGGFSTPFAGKTGTTQNQSDAWFVGFTPELVAGVWSGANYRSIRFEDITRGQASNMALPVFGRFFKKVFADSTLHYEQNFEFERPANFNIDINCTEMNSKLDDNEHIFDSFW